MHHVIESPCVRKCNLVGDMCTGCGRTRYEIASWLRLKPSERANIMARLRDATDKTH